MERAAEDQRASVDGGRRCSGTFPTATATATIIRRRQLEYVERKGTGGAVGEHPAKSRVFAPVVVPVPVPVSVAPVAVVVVPGKHIAPSRLHPRLGVWRLDNHRRRLDSLIRRGRHVDRLDQMHGTRLGCVILVVGKRPALNHPDVVDVVVVRAWLLSLLS